MASSRTRDSLAVCVADERANQACRWAGRMARVAECTPRAAADRGRPRPGYPARVAAPAGARSALLHLHLPASPSDRVGQGDRTGEHRRAGPAVVAMIGLAPGSFDRRTPPRLCPKIPAGLFCTLHPDVWSTTAQYLYPSLEFKCF